MSSLDDAALLLTEIRRLAERFPLPHPIWHRFVPEMHDVIRDLFVALDATAVLSEAQAELARRLEDGSNQPADDAGGPALRDARERLRNLAVPQGEHPYLDEIRVTLEAAGDLLSALAVVGGEEEFGRRLEAG